MRSIVEPQGEGKWLFPFDILLLGGDDIVMVTTAKKALELTATIADNFNEQTKSSDNPGGYTLSVGVILAPTHFPFSALQALAEETLKAAKKARAEAQADANKEAQTDIQPAFVNFMVVTSGTSLSYERAASAWSATSPGDSDKKEEFYATLRPFSLPVYKEFLRQLHLGHKRNINRSKLYQLREAVLKMNKTGAVLDGRALLRRSQGKEREFFEGMLPALADLKRQEKPTDVPQPTDSELFPWFQQGERAYYTPFYDLVELYDFISAPSGED